MRSVSRGAVAFCMAKKNHRLIEENNTVICLQVTSQITFSLTTETPKITWREKTRWQEIK